MLLPNPLHFSRNFILPFRLSCCFLIHFIFLGTSFSPFASPVASLSTSFFSEHHSPLSPVMLLPNPLHFSRNFILPFRLSCCFLIHFIFLRTSFSTFACHVAS